MADDADRHAALLRAGAALFNDGAYAAAAAAWEPERSVDREDADRADATSAARDPVRIAGGSSPDTDPTAVVDGGRPTLDTLDPDAIAAAAVAVARVESTETDPIRRAAAAARDGEDRYLALLHDFVARPAARPLLTDRLQRLTDRRDDVNTAVDGLFEEG